MSFFYQELSQIEGLYRRYSDDIVIICEKKDEDHIRTQVVSYLTNKLNLDINEDKVDRSVFKRKDGRLMVDKPLQYLGFSFDGERILIRNPSIAKYYRQMKKSVRASARIARHNRNKAVQKGIGTKHGRLYKSKLLSRYSHLGVNGKKRNFYIYAKEASQIMNEPLILSQMSRSWQILIQEINKHEERYKL